MLYLYASGGYINLEANSNSKVNYRPIPFDHEVQLPPHLIIGIRSL